MERKAKLVLVGSICLTDIPKEVIRCPSNGKKYLNLAVMELSEPNKYGDTHFISCAPRKEERIEGRQYIIGNFKRWIEQPSHISMEEIENSPSMEESENLPF